jgi:hypothetical protein
VDGYQPRHGLNRAFGKIVVFEFTLRISWRTRRGPANASGGSVDPIIATTAAVVAGQFIALLGLRARLRARLRWEHAHRRLLVELAQALPEASR